MLVCLDQLQACVGERERLEQLQLIVEVVLEPEDDLPARRERLLEEPVAPLERLEQRPLRAPAALAQEACAHSAQLGRPNRGHGTLVQDVLPREHRAAERRLPQGVARALPVGDVQQRPELRVAAAAREVGGVNPHD
ncbi:MAG: hypothetical protein QOG06_1534 [Gaiellaceae bacterium]|nr:hypothetical protein [Gaiellaceae bacterium]